MYIVFLWSPGYSLTLAHGEWDLTSYSLSRRKSLISPIYRRLTNKSRTPSVHWPPTGQSLKTWWCFWRQETSSALSPRWFLALRSTPTNSSIKSTSCRSPPLTSVKHNPSRHGINSPIDPLSLKLSSPSKRTAHFFRFFRFPGCVRFPRKLALQVADEPLLVVRLPLQSLNVPRQNRNNLF